MSQYTVCDYRFYLPTSEARIIDIKVNGNPIVRVFKARLGIGYNLSVDDALFKSTTVTQNATTDCIQKLWVVKNEDGTVIDQLEDVNEYVFNQNTPGKYYVSYAISDEIGFDGKTIEIIVEDESSGNPTELNIDCPDASDPKCGDGICDENEKYCIECQGDCGIQYIDEGFRINGSLNDEVYLCSKGFTISPKKLVIKLGSEWEYRFCWLSLFIWADCPYKYINYTIDIIECRGDKTETNEVFTYYRRFEQDGYGVTDDNEYFKQLYISDIDYNFKEGTYYKVVFKTYFEGSAYFNEPAGWKSSYKYIYILPPSIFTPASLSTYTPYKQSDIVIENQTIAGGASNPVVQFIAKNSLKIGPSAKIFANFHASIDPILSFDCNTLKSTEFLESDTICIVHEPVNTNNFEHDFTTLTISEEFVQQDNIIRIFPNPVHDALRLDIRGVNISGLTLHIVNNLGQELKCFPVITGEEQFNISHLNKGVYHVLLKDRGITIVREKIIKL